MPANHWCFIYGRRAQQQGFVVAGYKSFVSEIHRISIQLVSRSVLKLDKGKNADYLVIITPKHQQAFPSSNILRIAYHIWIQPSRKELHSTCFSWVKILCSLFFICNKNRPQRGLFLSLGLIRQESQRAPCLKSEGLIYLSALCLPILSNLAHSILKTIFSTHLSYTLSSASVIPAGIIHSVFVPRLPVMVSLFHIPLAE